MREREREREGGQEVEAEREGQTLNVSQRSPLFAGRLHPQAFRYPRCLCEVVGGAFRQRQTW